MLIPLRLLLVSGLVLVCGGLSPLLHAQEGPDGSVTNPSLSDDGRFVAFSTGSTNLIFGSSKDQANVGFFDRKTRRLYNGQRTGAASFWGGATLPQMSNDGAWMTFQSGNSAIPGHVSTDVFICSVRGQTEGLAPATGFRRISRNAAGEAGNGVSNYPTINADGRFIAYMSKATNLTADNVPAGVTQIYRYDRDADEDGIFDETGPGETATILVSQGLDGPGDGDSEFPTISADGSRILFRTRATNLPTHPRTSMMIWIDGTLLTTVAARRGLSPEGTITLTTGDIYFAGNINDDGVKFRYKDWTTPTLFKFPDYPAGNIPSSGANQILSVSEHPVPPLTDGENRQVWLFDRVKRQTVLVSTGPNGPGNDNSGQFDDNDAFLDLSRDARFAAFVTRATNFGFVDTNGTYDVIIRDLLTNSLDRIERDVTPPAWPDPQFQRLSHDDQSATFSWNEATDLGGIDHYELDFGPRLIRWAQSGHGYTATGLHPSTAYTVEIRAVDPSGNKTSGGTLTFTTAPDSGRHPGFSVTGFSVSEEGVALTFRSEPGKTYRMETSSDFNAWKPLEIGIASEGGFTSGMSETPAEIDGPLFLRIQEE
jgi:Tol biopolymer transport system component